MPEVNIPPCPTHGSRPRALHEESFFGIVTVIEELIGTISGVGTSSYSRCPYGYPANFEGVVRALEDLNTSVSGISQHHNYQRNRCLSFRSFDRCWIWYLPDSRWLRCKRQLRRGLRQRCFGSFPRRGFRHYYLQREFRHY